ncbi:MAG TPA: carbohydrate kinase family protein [Terriglobales bacterium]|nr:carbohydrate kinase family protein [Terriglobales bacterium]
MPRFDVTVAGELNLDLILYGLPEQLPTEREFLANGLMVTLGSSSAILAHNLAALGARVAFSSLIGDDPLGEIALQRLDAAGVDVSHVKKASGRTTGLTVILQHEGGRRILTYPGTMADMSRDDLNLEFLKSARHFHLSSFFLQPKLRPYVAELFHEMKAAGLSTSLDTNDDPQDQWNGIFEVLPYVDVFLPNEREALRLTGAANVQAAVNDLAKRVPVLAVKLGARGALARRGNEEFRCPAARVTPVDPVGAGDSFDAGFLYQYVKGADLNACLRYGNLAGALSTTMPGGTEAFRDPSQVKQFFSQHATLVPSS